MEYQVIQSHEENKLCVTPMWKGYVMQDAIFQTFWKRQSYEDSEKMNVGRRFGRGMD